MDKKIVVITMVLTTLFAVGSVILQTHGEGKISIGNVSEVNFEEGWSFSVSAEANRSGANASASPGVVNADSII